MYAIREKAAAGLGVAYQSWAYMTGEAENTIASVRPGPSDGG
jgi:hypothetical protein